MLPKHVAKANSHKKVVKECIKCERLKRNKPGTELHIVKVCFQLNIVFIFERPISSLVIRIFLLNIPHLVIFCFCWSFVIQKKDRQSIQLFQMSICLSQE